MNNNLILGIETSCDETAAAVLRNGRDVLSNIIFSQTLLHERYGGVVPEIASRDHLSKISLCVDTAISESGVTLDDIDAIAVTNRPGLVGALLVGVSYAKSLAFAVNKPVIAVNHIEGHICANYIMKPRLKPPFLCLVASGGHTSLYLVRSYECYELLGQTLDDAAGEAFDKTARALGLGYPGGRCLEDMAKNGNPDAIAFPRAINQSDNYNFSFSGLKSAALNHIKKGEFKREDIAASFQKAVVDVLVHKTIAAAEAHKIKIVALAGGVTANTALRDSFSSICKKHKLHLSMPDFVFCTDNAAMVATRGYFDFCLGKRADYSLNAYSRV